MLKARKRAGLPDALAEDIVAAVVEHVKACAAQRMLPLDAEEAPQLDAFAYTARKRPAWEAHLTEFSNARARRLQSVASPSQPAVDIAVCFTQGEGECSISDLGIAL